MNPVGTVTGTTTYYPAGGAMRVNGTLYYVVSTGSTQRLKDHLGSASVVTDSSGNIVGEQRYYPFGETRLTTGTLYTDKLFTRWIEPVEIGQRNIAGLGIYHYQSRFYSPKLGRFLSADSIVPNPFNPQDFNRFAYVRNNPVNYVDSSGHAPSDPNRPIRNGISDPRRASGSKPSPGTGSGSNGSGGGGGGGGPLGGASGGTGGEPTPPITGANLGGGQPNPSLDPTINNDCTTASNCAVVSYEELDTYVNNSFETYQIILWGGAAVSFLIAGAAFNTCSLTLLLGCAVGAVWGLIGVV